MELSVRVKLQTPQGAFCSFTASGVPFLYSPSPGDFIILNFGDDLSFVAKIKNSVHYCLGDPVSLIDVDDYKCSSYDHMLKIIDCFKAEYRVEAFDSSDKNPESYYAFYRSVIRLMGLDHQRNPVLTPVPSQIKVFAESCRAVVLGELFKAGIQSEREFDKAFRAYNPVVQDLHDLVLSKKKSDDDQIPIFELLREWEPMLNPNKKITWDADPSSYIAAGKMVFSRIKSLAEDEIPERVQ